MSTDRTIIWGFGFASFVVFIGTGAGIFIYPAVLLACISGSFYLSYLKQRRAREREALKDWVQEDQRRREQRRG